MAPTTLGTLMAASTTLQNEQLLSPTQELRKIIDGMKQKLSFLQMKYPDNDYTKQIELIRSLMLVHQQLEQCEPLELGRTINAKLKEAYHDKSHPDVAVVYIPLKDNLPEIEYCKPAIVDLCGFNVLTERDYDFIGLYTGRYWTSQEGSKE